MMTSITCKDCRHHLRGYIERDLPPMLRRRVATHLDECASCYRAYQRERELIGELNERVPLIGRSEGTRFSAIWNTVQTEMGKPQRSSWSRLPKRYLVVATVLVIIILLPSMGFHALQNHQIVMALPPTPTETVERTIQAVAMATAQCACTPPASVTDTPEVTPPAQPNYAPDLSATQAP